MKSSFNGTIWSDHAQFLLMISRNYIPESTRLEIGYKARNQSKIKLLTLHTALSRSVCTAVPHDVSLPSTS